VKGRILKFFFRKKENIIFSDLTRTTPISSKFGMDRGTPIDRYYVESFLNDNRQYVAGSILEVGECRYSKQFASGKTIQCHALCYSGNQTDESIIGDLTHPATLPLGVYDCFICTQTLNFIYNVKAAIEGSYHLLKPGGVMLATVAGITQVSRYDMERWGDFWRFTPLSVMRLFSDVFGESVKVYSFGNVLASTALLQGIAVEDLPNKSLLNYQDEDYPVVISIIARKQS